jgi:hypothetical protein
MHKEHYLGKFENRAFPSFVTEVHLFYRWGVDYKGLNRSVTSMISHMAWHIECIRRQTISKHHAYIVSTT